MASATMKAVDNTPSSSTFKSSYAQAAAGRAASAAASTSQATSGANTPSKENTASADTSSGVINATVMSDLDRSVKLNGDIAPPVSSKSSESGAKNEQLSTSGSSSPNLGAAPSATPSKEDMTLSTPSIASDSPWDRQPSNSMPGDKATDTTERRKGKKGRRERNAEKETEIEKEEVKQPTILVAAPPPAVNIWQMRKEAFSKITPVVTETPQVPEASTNGNETGNIVKPVDAKKKTRSSPEDQEKTAAVGQSSGPRENQNKVQKKGDSNSRKEDSNGKRLPRGGRAEKEDKTPAAQIPPPVEDSVSWPTPETALEDEKRKAQGKNDKDEKDESASNKPRPKEKWEKMPYVPSVAFNTPLPVRGGRGGRGGGRGGGRDGNTRNGHGANGSVATEKSFTPTNSSNAEARDRGRETSNNNRAASLPPTASKRNSGEEIRKTTATNVDKNKPDTSSMTKGDNTGPKENRRSSLATQADNKPSYQLPVGAIKPDGPNGAASESQANPKPSKPEQKTENAAANDSANGNTSGVLRERGERGEGRSERGGRGGGMRGRGGHNFPNGQTHPQNLYANGHGPPSANGFALRSNTGPYSPPIQQPQYGNPFNNNGNVRGNRNSLPPPRSASISNNANGFSRYSPNMGPGGPQMAPIHTGAPSMYDYQNPTSMSAVPYNHYIDQWSLLNMVTMQLNYYFSIDNLCKDVFLRKHMDSQGFVFLTFISNFKRIQTLTQDYALLRHACIESTEIEIVVGEDGIERVRRNEGWDKWVLTVEDRDPAARNSGPAQLFPLSPVNRIPQTVLPPMMQHQAPLSAPAFSPNGTESNFRSFHVPSDPPAVMDNAQFSHTDSAMSAAAPDFAPRSHLNDITPHEMDGLRAETTFADSQINDLQLVLKSAPEHGDSISGPPTQVPSPRTFSNGSIDVRSANEEAVSSGDRRQGRALANGTSPRSDISPEGFRRTKSPFDSLSSLSPASSPFANSPLVKWSNVQTQRVSGPEGAPYPIVRELALRHRHLSAVGVTHADMKVLYDFWPHFLIRNFNPGMYLEFRDLAFDDAKNRNDDTGLKKLIQFYDDVLNSRRKTIPEAFATHYVDLVKSEDPTKGRPGFSKLRASWRNGALDLKSRKLIDSLIDSQLREELEG